MKELNLKIENCDDCCYLQDGRGPEAEVIHSGFSSFIPICAKAPRKKNKLQEGKTLFEKIVIPDWCPLDDAVDPGVKVGTTVMIVRDGKVLLGERGDKVETGKNMYSFPGGRMDYGESSPKKSLAREIEEETGLLVDEKDLEFLHPLNDFFPENNKHYVSLVHILRLKKDQEPINKEKEKCKGWKWFSPNSIPKNTLKVAKKTIQQFSHLIKNPADKKIK